MKTIIILGKEKIGKTKFFAILKEVLVETEIEVKFETEGSDPRDYSANVTIGNKLYYLLSMGDEGQRFIECFKEAQKMGCDYFISACRDTVWETVKKECGLSEEHKIVLSEDGVTHSES